MSSVEIRAIAGYEGIYSVTSDGRVYSHARVTSHGASRKGRWLKPGLNSSGYQHCMLYDQNNTVSRTVHRLVADAFIPNPDCLATVNHRDGDKLNNRVDNLEWSTLGDNIRHAWANGMCEGNRAAAKRRLGTKLGPMSDAHKAAISAGNKGKTVSDETKAAISAAQKGRKRGPISDAHKAAVSAANKHRWAEWRKANGRGA